MSNPTIPTKQTGDQLTAAEVNSIVQAIISKADGDHVHPLPAHGHGMGEITGLADALNGKAPTSHTHQIGNISGLQGLLDAKQIKLTAGANIAITPEGVISSSGAPGGSVTVDPTIIDGSANAVSGNAVYDALAGKAPSSHSHTIGQVTGLQAALDAAYQAAGGSAAFATNNYSLVEPIFWIRSTTRYNGQNITDLVLGPLYAKDSDGFYYRRQLLFGKRAHASWWGVVGGTGADQYAAFQQAVDACLTEKIGELQLPKGVITVSQGVVVRDPNYGFNFVSLNLYGTGTSYDPEGLGVGTGIRVTSGQCCCLYVQCVKGMDVHDVHFYGQNTGLANYSAAQISAELNGGATNGISNDPQIMHAGIRLDAFYTAAHTKYPNKTAHYNYVSGQYNGSTNFRTYNCKFSYFAVGIANSGVGRQNGENHKHYNTYVQYCIAGSSNGDAQNRTVDFFGYTGWDRIIRHFDCKTYGLGMPPTVYGFNIAGYTKYLCRLGAFYGNIFRVYGSSHSELKCLIGGCFEGKSTEIHLNGCQLYFPANIPYDDGSGHYRQPSAYAQCDKLLITDCLITNYNQVRSFFRFSVNHLCITNTTMSAPVLHYAGLYNYKRVGCVTYEEFNKDFDDLTMTATAGINTAITNINEAAHTWQFSGNTAGMQIGAYVRINPKTAGQLLDEYGVQPAWLGAGTIQSIAGSVVTVSGLTFGMANGQSVDLVTQKYTITPAP